MPLLTVITPSTSIHEIESITNHQVMLMAGVTADQVTGLPASVTRVAITPGLRAEVMASLPATVMSVLIHPGVGVNTSKGLSLNLTRTYLALGLSAEALTKLAVCATDQTGVVIESAVAELTNGLLAKVTLITTTPEVTPKVLDSLADALKNSPLVNQGNNSTDLSNHELKNNRCTDSMNRRNKRKDYDKPNLMTNGRGSLFSSPLKKQAIVCVNKPTHAERNPLTLDSVSPLRTDESKKALRRGRMVAEEQRVQSALRILLSLKLSSNPVGKQIEETDPSNFILRVN